MGFLPILDIVYAPFLPHKGENFAANVVRAGRLVRHNAFRGGDDRGAKALHDLRHIFTVGVDTQAGLGNAADARDNGSAGLGVFQCDADDALNIIVLDLNAP